MKLDLLYEIDAPRPWDGPHPYGQRAREQRAYAEMLEQMRLADEVGFHTAWFVEHHFREGRSHCPAPEVVIGALTQATQNIRLGFGDPVALRVHASRTRRGEGRDGRHPLEGARRVGDRPVDAHGADGLPCRPGAQP